MLETARFSIFYFCVIMINTLALSIAKRRIRIFLTTSMQDALYLSFLIKIKRGFPSMLFNSVVYITIFQPVVIGGWYLLQRLKNPVWSKIFLFGMSLLFYGYYNFYYVGILIASLLLNYGCSILLRKACSDKIRRFILTAGILGNLRLNQYDVQHEEPFSTTTIEGSDSGCSDRASSAAGICKADAGEDCLSESGYPVAIPGGSESECLDRARTV